MKKLFVVFLLILIWLQYRLWSPEGGISEWLRLQNELAIAEAKISKLEAHNEALKNIVLDLQNHTDAIETQAREVLHFISPNETFFRIITVPKEKPESYVPENLPRTKLSTPEVETTSSDLTAEAPP
ncbi:MAG: septum formation initiator family protein [Thiotrichales bacterium]|jgi:cell division protein FtsB|nr:septum formation initiator family protein [Thiotrichales bacterium]